MNHINKTFNPLSKPFVPPTKASSFNPVSLTNEDVNKKLENILRHMLNLRKRVTELEEMVGGIDTDLDGEEELDDANLDDDDDEWAEPQRNVIKKY